MGLAGATSGDKTRQQTLASSDSEGAGIVIGFEARLYKPLLAYKERQRTFGMPAKKAVVFTRHPWPTRTVAESHWLSERGPTWPRPMCPIFSFNWPRNGKRRERSLPSTQKS